MRFGGLGHAAGGFPSVATLRAIAIAFRRDPTIADRLGREAIEASPDAAAASAAVGALFDALADPGRARHAWQAAVDASDEPAFERGLAETQARAGDAAAALVTGAMAAAASGDPAPVWIAIARGLIQSDHPADAIDAARRAMRLAGPHDLPIALEIAEAASRTLGRDEQAAELARQRAHLAPPSLAANTATGAADPTDTASAIAAVTLRADASSLARLWVATRWNPRDIAARAVLRAALPPTDPRRAAIDAELVDLAADDDPSIGLTAAQALR
jgi:hypothetical protein